MGVLAWEALSGGQIPYSSLHDEQQVKETILTKEKDFPDRRNVLKNFGH